MKSLRFEQVAFKFLPQKLSLTELQSHYFAVFQQERSIEKTVIYFLKNGWLVNFNQLLDLVNRLDQGGILNPSLKNITPPQGSAKVIDPKFSDFIQWPFFRTLPPLVQSLLWKNHMLVDIPPDTKVLSEGENTRDLWTQIMGYSSISTGEGNQKKSIGMVDPLASFGELGFFMGTPRKANISTLTPSRFLKIPYTDELGQLIKNEIFNQLKFRFQVLRAFIHSPILNKLPESTMDELIFKGKLLSTKANQLLFQEGDPGSSCYFIIEGQIDIFQGPKKINSLGQGQSLGEIALFVSQGKRTATAYSTKPGLVLELKQTDFYMILANHLRLAAELEFLAHKRVIEDQNRSQKAS